jgi:hypothetical protein
MAMVLTAYQPNRLVTYSSVQAGLPQAFHDATSRPMGDGFRYRLVVEFEARSGLQGLFDRLLVARGVRAAFQNTLEALDREFRAFSPSHADPV